MTLLEFTAALDACHDRAGRLVASRQGWTLASAQRLPQGREIAPALAAVQGESAPDSEQLTIFSDELVRLHRRTLRQVLDGAVARLDQRESEGANLLNRQLVRGAMADVALVLAEAEDLLALPGCTAARRWRIHRQLVDAGRTAIKLYGASGFQADGPGTVLHLTELLGNTYLHPGERDE